MVGAKAKSNYTAVDTINYYLARDGHKIIKSEDLETVGNLLNNMLYNNGVRWYYIIDTANKKVMLPVTVHGFEPKPVETMEKSIVNSVAAVGQYIPDSMPTHTHDFSFPFSAGGEETGYPRHASRTQCAHHSFEFSTGDANYDGYMDRDTRRGICPRGTKMYMYFYCGKNS